MIDANCSLKYLTEPNIICPITLSLQTSELCDHLLCDDIVSDFEIKSSFFEILLHFLKVSIHAIDDISIFPL